MYRTLCATAISNSTHSLSLEAIFTVDGSDISTIPLRIPMPEKFGTVGNFGRKLKSERISTNFNFDPRGGLKMSRFFIYRSWKYLLIQIQWYLGHRNRSTRSTVIWKIDEIEKWWVCLWLCNFRRFPWNLFGVIRLPNDNKRAIYTSQL